MLSRRLTISGMQKPVVCDTHALIYWALEPKRLSVKARREIERALARGDVACADISLWEIAMLSDRGRIKLANGAKSFLDDLILALKLNLIPINTEIAVLAQTVCSGQGDPADRLIAATAKYLDAPLLTQDAKLAANTQIKTIW